MVSSFLQNILGALRVTTSKIQSSSQATTDSFFGLACQFITICVSEVEFTNTHLSSWSGEERVNK